MSEERLNIVLDAVDEPLVPPLHAAGFSRKLARRKKKSLAAQPPELVGEGGAVTKVVTAHENENPMSKMSQSPSQSKVQSKSFSTSKKPSAPKTTGTKRKLPVPAKRAQRGVRNGQMPARRVQSATLRTVAAVALTLQSTPPWAAAYAEVAHDIDAISDDDTQPLSTDVGTAFSRGTLLTAGLMANLAAIKDELPKQNLQMLKRLPLFRDALMHAHVIYTAATTPPSALAATVAEALDVRRVLVTDGTALAQHGLIDGTKLPTLKASSSHVDIAVDVAALASLLLASWDAIASQTAITKQQLLHAQELSVTIMNATAAKGMTPAAITELGKLRARAFTAYVRLYNEVRRAVKYVRAPFGDEDTVAPSMFAGRGGGGGKSTPVVTTPAVDPSPVVAAAKPVVATQAATTPVLPPVPVGYPGGNPFA